MNSEELSSLLDVLIPADAERGMPGAGALGLSPELCRSAPEILPLVDAGLRTLHAGARAAGAPDFASLPGTERVAAVRALSEAEPALLPALLFHLCRLYYAHPTMLAALGMPPRPPHPEGYEMEPNDLGLLDAVRARERIYREVQG